MGHSADVFVWVKAAPSGSGTMDSCVGRLVLKTGTTGHTWRQQPQSVTMRVSQKTSIKTSAPIARTKNAAVSLMLYTTWSISLSNAQQYSAFSRVTPSMQRVAVPKT